MDAMEAKIKELEVRIEKLEDDVQMHDFFWDGLGKTWRRRGLKNAIGVAEYVENQDEYIKELEAKQPKWISVKDRLPPNDYAFVVACDSKGENDSEVVYYDCDTNRWDNGEYSFPFEVFTHWMPLPEAPKE